MSEFVSYFNETHDQVRESVRKFVAEHITPNINEWEESGSFPRELYHLAGDAGILGLGYAECYGGVGEGDVFMKVAASEELMRSGSGGLVASLGSLDIALPTIAKWGSEELKQRVIPEVLSGRKIAALAITEPSGGSDVAGLKTRAVSDGDYYRVSGSKTFITSGTRADYYTVAVRTGGDGFGGVSLLLMEKGMPGFSVGQPLKKMGWWASDTAHLHFDNVKVPVSHLLGEENAGFKVIMNNFNMERFWLAAMAYGYALVCYEEALDWAKQRQTFGKRLIDHQVVRHKLVDMATQLTTTRALLEDTAYRMGQKELQGADLIAQISMSKNVATRTMQFCADAAVQTLGGMGFMRGTKSERIYREVKVNMIGGGAEEIMKDLISRQLGY